VTHRLDWLYGLIVPGIVLVVTVIAATRDWRRTRGTIRVNGREERRTF